MDNKKRVLVLVVIVSVMIGFIGISIVSVIGEDLEGELAEQKPATATLTLENEPPVVIDVSGVRDVNAFTPPVIDSLDLTGATPDEVTDVYVDFIAYDPNGPNDIVVSSAIVQFNHTENDLSDPPDDGQNLRNDFNCVENTVGPDYYVIQAGDFNNQYPIGASVRNFTCNVKMHFFDTSYDYWQINASIMDGVNRAENISVYFDVPGNTAFLIGHSLLTWSAVPTSVPPVVPADATSQPILLNNTGNLNYGGSWQGKLRMIGLQLQGFGTGSPYDDEYIRSEYFSVNAQDTTCTASGANKLNLVNQSKADGSAPSLAEQDMSVFATLLRGNSSLEDFTTAKEELYFCLEQLDIAMTSQEYSTSYAGPRLGSTANWQIITSNL